MSLEIDRLKEEYAAIKEAALEEYYTFLQFKSVSSEPSFKEQVEACAAWLSDYLRKIGFSVEIWRSKKDPNSHPVIFATHLKAGPEQPVLLLYNHYDVQPVDPLELWHSPPFQPVVKENQVYARGAQDNKGQCFYVLLALKQMIETQGNLPINIKLCIEGEEECGSLALAHLLVDHQQELKADYLTVVDLNMQDSKTPAATLGVRGITTMDLLVEGSKMDLHSGSHGGLAFNPIHALIEILAKVRNEQGKIAIPGFYDDVAPLTAQERAKLDLHFDEEKYANNFNQPATGGEKEFSPLERNWLRPTIEVNGIGGGYGGAGFKTVIPAKAFAKLSCRIVPHQDPQKIGQLVASFLEKQAPAGVHVKVHLHGGGGRPGRSKSDSPALQAYAEACREVFGVECAYIYSGASIPIATALAEAAGSDLLLIGLGLDTDEIHAPNEHFGLDRIEKGFLVISRMVQLLRNGRNVP